MKDVMELLGAPEKDVLKLIRNGRFPAQMINHQYVFNKQEIKEWMISSGRKVDSRFLGLKLGEIPVSAAALIEKGGIICGAKGRTMAELISDIVPRMSLPATLDRKETVSLLIEREELMPTAVGMGIAIPHPRRPVISDIKNESITACLLTHPVDYSAPDGQPVHTLFIVLSANQKRHLEILSRLLFICQQPDFYGLLLKKAPAQDIIKSAWEQESLAGGLRK